MRVDLELAAQDLTGVRVAARLGIERVELGSALALGGLTPSIGLIEAALAQAPQVHVLVRPRAGGFQYDAQETAVMCADIQRSVAAGAHGVVVGALDADRMPDLGALEKFVEAARGAEVTFHRAIDTSADILRAAQLLVGRGVSRILTSGGAPSAFEGRAMLAEIVRAVGGQLQVQAGAGITPENVRAIVATGVAGVHFSAKMAVPGAAAGAGGVDFGGYESVDPTLAAATVAAARGA